MRISDWSSDVCSSDLPEDKAAAQAEIWEKEQAIYAARGRGDIGAYLSNTATDYLAWSPLRAQPQGNAGLRETGKALARTAEQRAGEECVRPCRSRWSPYP